MKTIMVGSQDYNPNRKISNDELYEGCFSVAVVLALGVMVSCSYAVYKNKMHEDLPKLEKAFVQESLEEKVQ